jgi:hypothetical protein
VRGCWGTTLFNSVSLNIKNWTENNQVTLDITVKESWYLFPVPIFELADRNISVWWNEFNHDFKRTNYGMRLGYRNSTGRNDPLSALIRFGYTPNFSMSYFLPYIDRKQTLGLGVSAGYSSNREVNFNTLGNKPQFFRNVDSNIAQRRFADVSLNFRPHVLSQHKVSVGWMRSDVDSFIVNFKNREYFGEDRTQQAYFWANYGFFYDDRDLKVYPSKGVSFAFNLSKSGLRRADDVNSLTTSIQGTYYRTLTKWLRIQTLAKLKTELIRTAQPYNFQRGLGYGSSALRGYQYYVVDGLDYGYLKQSFRFRLLDRDFDFSKIFKQRLLKYIGNMPLKCYFAANFDAGFAHTPAYSSVNPLNNRALYGGGIGLDIVAYNSVLWQFEYNINHLKEHGFFLSIGAGF